MLPARATVSCRQSGFCLSLLFLAAALGCTVLESIAAFDQLAQAPLFRRDEWMINKAFHANYKMLLYTGPKIFISIIGSIFLLLFLASFSDRYRIRLKNWRRPALIVCSSIILVPLTVAAIKAASGVYGPVDMLPYGGRHPHIGLIEQLWSFGATAGGRNFPAGHASGGFALMALSYLPLRGLWKRILFSLGFSIGWAMGLYQMARGEHFLSHTLTTMFIALAIIALLSCCIAKRHRAC